MTLFLPSTWAIGSFGGTSATGAACCAAACNSLSARAGLGVPPAERSGAVAGVHPSTGSSLSSTSPLSEALFSTVAPESTLRFAAENWAVRPSRVAR